MKKQTRLFNLLIIITLFMGACNLPSANQGEELSLTAAAQTVEALLSATPASGTATPSVTPLPALATLTPIPLTNTPAATATSNCNVAQFVTDVTIPDGTVMTPGQAFIKKWRIKNIGSCAWSGYIMAFDNGDSMNGPASKAISALNPGQEVDLEVNLTAPSTAGNYRGYWRITTNGGVLVPVVNGYQGNSFYVDIKVQSPSAPAFAVSSAPVTNGGTCGAFTATASITTNGAGSVTYHWVRSDGAIDGVSHPAVVFSAAGTQSVNTTWSVSAPGTYWIDIYIDTPNNQQFGRASFTCP
ncbi:MAG: hypothetical protein H7Y59_08170 [Anaerolineales bacterium]|nr:hypothetical protein [Anaerolineales bacterium]